MFVPVRKLIMYCLFFVSSYESFIFPVTTCTSKTVFLNHTYVIIDEDTYNEIKRSDFLKDAYCHCQEETYTGVNDRGEIHWTALYLTGEHTYFEIFNKKDAENLHAITTGDIGFGFSVDTQEEFEKITSLFKQKYPTIVNYGLVEKSVGKTMVPWFYQVEATIKASMLPYFDTWVMAYYNNITRQDYNREYNAITFDKNKLFKDIEEVIILLRDDIKRKFIERQTLLGYTCKDIEDSTVCYGPGVIFIIKRSGDQSCKLVSLKMSLNRPVSNLQTYKIGNSIIELENQTALWTFK